MAGWKDVSEIVAWQLSREMKLKTYALLKRPEFKRDPKLCDQMRSAARSTPGNIAEGFGRFGNKEFARFARIAKASQIELLNHLTDAHDQELLTDSEFDELDHLGRRAVKACVGLIRHLETTKDPPRPKPPDR
jgi:four helix bundle protein